MRANRKGQARANKLCPEVKESKTHHSNRTYYITA